MANFVVIVQGEDDPGTIEYYGPFLSAEGNGDSENDAVTWMSRYVQDPSTAMAVEMFDPRQEVRPGE